ncbi:MAG TPA: hypothetical protein VNW97_11185 [Candidatus Saccharimonadales bacterium]|nr:hypothetical protein [Candidatus Saccharimonadales bacterium]
MLKAFADGWQPKGSPEAVNVHDCPTQGLGKAIPYGAYDVTRDEAAVAQFSQTACDRSM